MCARTEPSTSDIPQRMCRALTNLNRGSIAMLLSIWGVLSGVTALLSAALFMRRHQMLDTAEICG